MDNLWLPIGIGSESQYHVVRWMKVPRGALTDPFFQWTIERLRAVPISAHEYETEINGVIRLGEMLPPVAPAGFVFHVSRCGSTLLMNCLRTFDNVLCLSEAQPIIRALQVASSPSEHWKSIGQRLLPALMTLFQHHGDGYKAVMSKGVSSDIRLIPLIRSIWPAVPVIILVRDPTEVVVSNVEEPPTWTNGLRTASQRERRDSPFGPLPGELLTSPMEEVLAWTVGRFYSIALELMNLGCAVIDYSDLNVREIMAVAERLGLQPHRNQDAILRRELKINAKKRELRFKGDCTSKQGRASEHTRTAVEKWAHEHYHALRRASLAPTAQVTALSV